MPFETGLSGRVFGEGVFENDAALRAVDYLDELAGLDKLEPRVNAAGEKIVYSVYATQCSNSEAAELVRGHLDSGVLRKLISKMVANYFNPLAVEDYTCHGYVPVILGACAMSHGCSTLLNAPAYRAYFLTYRVMLIGIFETAPLMDAAKEQMRKALMGPGGFEHGTAIDFTRFARPAGYSPNLHDPYMATMHGGIPDGYESKYQPVLVEDRREIGPCFKEDLDRSSNKTKCGGCFTSSDRLLTCARCQDQFYCNKVCQTKDYKGHKMVCRKPEDATLMKEQSAMWRNTFHARCGPMLVAPGVAVFVRGESEFDDIRTFNAMTR